jgi:hypothetical protein
LKILLLPLLLLIISIGISPAFAATDLTLTTDMNTYEPGERVEISGDTKNDQLISIQVKDPTGKSLLVRTITADGTGSYSLGFKIPKTAIHGDYSIVASIALDMLPLIETISISVQDKIIESTESTTVVTTTSAIDDSVCGTGTVMKDGKCVVDSSQSGGGCLIATATYGSEMAVEVQQLRELRDNTLLNTESGTQFMGMFNDVYYSFSPYIADYERENPVFKELVKVAITPMISSLSVMSYADSESEVISLGLSVIALNLGMYLGVPIVIFIGVKKHF